MKKKVIIIVLIIAILVVVYFFFIKKEKSDTVVSKGSNEDLLSPSTIVASCVPTLTPFQKWDNDVRFRNTDPAVKPHYDWWISKGGTAYKSLDLFIQSAYDFHLSNTPPLSIFNSYHKKNLWCKDEVVPFYNNQNTLM